MSRDQILQLMRIKGPIIPANISKQINQNILMTGAMLAELSSQKLVKITHLKIGSSPLYYLEGQEAKLQEFSNRLAPHEKTAYSLIRESKIMRDKEVDARTRVALRLIKDFAIPLQVTANQKDEIFWKWYLTSNQDAEQLIKVKLGLVQAKPIETPVQKLEPTEKPLAPKPIAQTPPKKILPKTFERKILPKKPVPQQKSIPVPQKIIEPIKKPEPPQKGFLKEVYTFFTIKNIRVKSIDTIRKNKEFDFIIALPTALGELDYYVKALDKKKLNESDVNNTFANAQLKKLPPILLASGQMSKKGENLVNNQMKGFIFRTI